MKKFLLIGLDPEAIDYSAPNVPPGGSAEKLFTDIAEAQKQLADRGNRLDSCKVQLDASSAEASVTAHLVHSTYECILIGGGIRETNENVEMLERIINSIRQHAPSTPIGFVSLPHDSSKVIDRVMSTTTCNLEQRKTDDYRTTCASYSSRVLECLDKPFVITSGTPGRSRPSHHP